VLTRNPEKASELREMGAGVVLADLAGTAWHDKVPVAPEFALNCVSSGGGGVESYRHSYLAGMESILAWAQQRGAVGILVYTSSTSVYAQGGGVEVDETMPTVAATDRAQVLVDTESRLASAADVAGRWFVLRLAGIYGPGRSHLLEQVRSGTIAGVGDHHLNLIHRDDITAAAAACLAAPDTHGSDVFNVADDSRTTKAQMAAWLAAELGLPAPRFTGEPFGGRRALVPDRVIDNRKLKRLLNWRPRYPTFREGYASLLSR
jgi:nucleoside-diphosphate-sugar epimerase